MTKLGLTLGCDQNDRTQALFDGRVIPDGIDLTLLSPGPSETFWRMLQHKEFDVAEMSMSSYMMVRDRGYDDFIAIPVFPYRVFRHSFVFVNNNSSIESPADLKGKRIGVPEYQMTAALWVKGILQHEYDVYPRDVKWYHGGLEESGREERLELNLPEEIEVNDIPQGETLSRMLGRGDLDSLIAPRRPSSFSSDSVERLFPNYREVEEEYYRRTGHFPIMHTVVLRREIYDEHKWAAQELTKAFTESKNYGLRRLERFGRRKIALPWTSNEVEKAKALIGDDFYPYGIDENQETLKAMIQFSSEQGLIDEKLTIDELFAPSTTHNRTFN